MEYTIRELADLSGVTTRTLRWYDQIGLLKPGRVAENGYRYYGAAQVDRLQDILYYRALGVELAQIKACLDDPSFDRLAALRGHLTALEQEQARLEALIRSVRKTISAQERKELMNDQEKFEALKQRAVAWHEETYGREAREKYGDREVDAAQNTVRGLTQEQYREWTGLGDEILRRLEDAVRSQTPPDSLEGPGDHTAPQALADPQWKYLRPVQTHGAGPALHPGRALYRLLRPDGPRLRPLPLRGGVPLGRADLIFAPGRAPPRHFKKRKNFLKKHLPKILFCAILIKPSGESPLWK